MKIIKEEYCPATVRRIDDTPRFLFYVAVNRTEQTKEALLEIAQRIVKAKQDQFGFFNAATIFFWGNNSPVGEIPAAASIVYSPNGKWEDALLPKEQLQDFKFEFDFYNFCETCWANNLLAATGQ